MKKCFYAMAAVLAALTSCSSDEENIKVADGEVTPVMLSVALPENSGTRVMEDDANIPGKGLKIAKLEYAVYDNHNKLILHSDQSGADKTIVKDPEDHGHFTIKVSLLKGHDYTFYLWASAAESPYTFDPATKSVAVNYAKVKANDETMDAFFGKHKFTIADEQTANDQYTVVLNRPFAQLNIMTNDEEYIKNIEDKVKNRDIESICVEVNQAPGRYSKLNLDTFEAGDPVSKVAFTAYYPNGWKDLVHAGDGDVAHYYYLATCYLLTGVTPDGGLTGGVGAAKEVTDLSITINFNDNTRIVINKANVPIRRSWRTNIWGALLTADVDVNCRIDFGFPDAYKDGPGADSSTTGPDDGDHSGDDNSNTDDID